MLPCTETSDVPGLSQGLQLAVPSHRRELQTDEVSTSAGLTSALANIWNRRIILAPGTYNLTAELSITRSVILEAAVAGSVTLNAQASSSSPRRVLYINVGSSGVVQLIGLGITGGYVDVRAHVQKFPSPLMGVSLTRLPRLSLAQLRPDALVDMSISILIFYNGCYLELPVPVWSTCHLRLKPQKFPRPDGKVADVLATTHACTTAAETPVNYSLYVPQRP
jgi:hypothetical protein